MLNEEDLLLDIIQLSPENSEWIISKDSWEKIPEVFREFIFNDEIGWRIFLNDKTKNQIVETVKKYEIFEKIVHQKITKDNEVIFKSYDNMSSSFVKSNFPKFSILIEKYKELDLLELPPDSRSL